MPNTVIVNASPRSDWNTAELLKEAKKSYHDNQFPIDMQEAYKLGVEISSATQ